MNSFTKDVESGEYFVKAVSENRWEVYRLGEYVGSVERMISTFHLLGMKSYKFIIFIQGLTRMENANFKSFINSEDSAIFEIMRCSENEKRKEMLAL